MREANPCGLRGGAATTRRVRSMAPARRPGRGGAPRLEPRSSVPRAARARVYRRERPWRALCVVCLVATLAGCERAPLRKLEEGRPAASSPPRLTMEALHASGGVPPGWQFTPPAGNPDNGRTLFVEYGCHSCHMVRGAGLPPPDREAEGAVEGPDLTGMGSHHPAGYFAESIVNPNAVLVEGPGYISEDGRSAMPEYPDLTLAELADLVAFLTSLTDGGAGADRLAVGGAVPGGPAGHRHAAPGSHAAHHPAGPGGGAVYLVQAQTVTNEELRAIDLWLAGEGGRRLRQAEGVTALSLYVSRSPAGRVLVTVFGFEDEGRLHALARRLAEPDPAGAYGGLAPAGDRLLFRSPALHEARAVGEGDPSGG